MKNCHGVEAPHSSPIQSIGVNGEVSSSAAPTSSSAAADELAGQPVAQRPVADLVVVLQERDEPVPGISRRSTGRPCSRPRKDE